MTYSIPPEDEDTVLQQADRAMYSAKEAGGDGIRQEVYGSIPGALLDHLLESGRA